MGPKMQSAPLFRHKSNWIFHVDCATLSKIDRADFRLEITKSDDRITASPKNISNYF